MRTRVRNGDPDAFAELFPVEAEGGSLRPWLLGIATNVARSHHRSNRRHHAAASASAAAHAAEERVEDHAEETAGRLAFMGLLGPAVPGRFPTEVLGTGLGGS